MQLPRASTSALADGYCPAIVAESLPSVSAVDAVACCAVACRAGNPAATKNEMPIAAIRGRALPIAFPCYLLGRSCGFDARRHVAHEAFETAVHLLGPQARRHRPGDEVGDSVFAHEGGQLLDAVLDIAD